MAKTGGDGAPVSFELREVWDSLLGSTREYQDQPIRRQLTRLCLPKMWVNGRMEETIMKLTIVGTLLIVAIAILAVLVLKAMLRDHNRPPKADNGGTQQ